MMMLCSFSHFFMFCSISRENCRVFLRKTVVTVGIIAQMTKKEKQGLRKEDIHLEELLILQQEKEKVFREMMKKQVTRNVEI